jgi:hypothetical protein
MFMRAVHRADLHPILPPRLNFHIGGGAWISFVREMMHKDPMDPVTLERWERFVARNNGAAQSAAPQASAATAA